ncbi:MAG: hypothetical protein IAE92_12600 [Burkholderiaceae bacterium]|nr:hypothetical protein [Burkholderiaceae bacterium]
MLAASSVPVVSTTGMALTPVERVARGAVRLAQRPAQPHRPLVVPPLAPPRGAGRWPAGFH